MTIDELIEVLEKAKEREGGDTPVCVRATKCLSSATAVPIQGAALGFDWEKGRVMISTEQPLERYYTDKDRAEQKKKSDSLKSQILNNRKEKQREAILEREQERKNDY